MSVSMSGGSVGSVGNSTKRDGGSIGVPIGCDVIDRLCIDSRELSGIRAKPPTPSVKVKVSDAGKSQEMSVGVTSTLPVALNEPKMGAAERLPASSPPSSSDVSKGRRFVMLIRTSERTID
jgi:hypothetical protein